MNNKLLKVAKVVVPVVSIVVTCAANYLAGKDLDDKVDKKVSEALANANKEA